LTVSASVGDDASKAKSLKIQKDKGRLSEKDIERMIADAEKYKEEDTKRKECIESRNMFENALYQAKSELETMEEAKKQETQTIVDGGFAWLEKQNVDTKKDAYDAELANLQSKLEAVRGATESEHPSESEPKIEEVD